MVAFTHVQQDPAQLTGPQLEHQLKTRTQYERLICTNTQKGNFNNNRKLILQECVEFTAEKSLVGNNNKVKWLLMDHSTAHRLTSAVKGQLEVRELHL